MKRLEDFGMGTLSLFGIWRICGIILKLFNYFDETTDIAMRATYKEYLSWAIDEALLLIVVVALFYAAIHYFKKAFRDAD